MIGKSLGFWRFAQPGLAQVAPALAAFSPDDLVHALCQVERTTNRVHADEVDDLEETHGPAHVLEHFIDRAGGVMMAVDELQRRRNLAEQNVVADVPPVAFRFDQGEAQAVQAVHQVLHSERARSGRRGEFGKPQGVHRIEEMQPGGGGMDFPGRQGGGVRQQSR